MLRVAEEPYTQAGDVGHFNYRRLVVDSNFNVLRIREGVQKLPNSGFMVCTRNNNINRKVSVMILPIINGKLRASKPVTAIKQILRHLDYFIDWLFYRSSTLPIA